MNGALSFLFFQNLQSHYQTPKEGSVRQERQANEESFFYNTPSFRNYYVLNFKTCTKVLYKIKCFFLNS